MNEPATKADLEQLRKEMHARFNQNAIEHGSIITRVDEQNRETRAHMASEIETVAGHQANEKNYMERILKALKRFMSRHGMGTDDL